MLRTATFLGKSSVLTAGEKIAGVSVNWSRKLKPIRDQSTLDCGDPITLPHCEIPKERCMMDLLPVPCGDWQEAYDEQNRKDTRVLAFGVGFFVFSLLCMHKVGMVRGYPDMTFV